jgi:hypothetical protein
VRTDEPSSSGDENVLAHDVLRSVKRLPSMTPPRPDPRRS